MTDDHDRCEFVNVSFGTCSPGLSRTKSREPYNGCVCVCVHAFVRACMHACVRACLCACVRACVRVYKSAPVPVPNLTPHCTLFCYEFI